MKEYRIDLTFIEFSLVKYPIMWSNMFDLENLLRHLEGIGTRFSRKFMD